MRRWAIMLAILFAAGAAEARCPALGWSTDCDVYSTCWKAVRACEEAEDKLEALEKVQDELDWLRIRVRKCLRSDDLDSLYCMRMKRG